MSMTEEDRKLIDSMSYLEMLRLWRFSPSDNPNLFAGDTGKYFAEVMKTKKNNLSPEDQVKTSKLVGWSK